VANILRGVLAVVLGLVAGSCVNMAIVVLGPYVIPPPPGVDVTDAESLGRTIHLFTPIHFVPPFLAHALGTLFGAVVASLVAAGDRSIHALVVGACFLAGGIAATFMIPAPTAFIVLDLAVAYLPMAWLGARLGRRIKRRAAV
jgi:hypothetical protein